MNAYIGVLRVVVKAVRYPAPPPTVISPIPERLSHQFCLFTGSLLVFHWHIFPFTSPWRNTLSPGFSSQRQHGVNSHLSAAVFEHPHLDINYSFSDYTSKCILSPELYLASSLPTPLWSPARLCTSAHLLNVLAKIPFSQSQLLPPPPPPHGTRTYSAALKIQRSVSVQPGFSSGVLARLLAPLTPFFLTLLLFPFLRITFLFLAISVHS